MKIAFPFPPLAAACAALAAVAALAQAPAPGGAPQPAAARKIVPVDRIVAVVNDEVLTLNELNERADIVVRQLRGAGGRVPPQDVLQRQLLERMIDELVQVQMAKEMGIKVDDATLDKTIQRIADDNNLSMTAFRAALERDGIRYERFRDDIRRELTVTRLREREVENAVVVTDAEIETEIARAAKERSGEAEFRLQHILVLLQQQSTPEQIEARRRRALQALSELRRGASFAEVSATFSDAPDALQGGNLGWRPAGRLPALFLDALAKMQPGETSDVLRSPNGFHIVRLLEKRGKAAEPKVTQTRARHILIRTKEGLSDADARARLARLRERIVAGEDFGELAKVHSDDGSAQKGGDLGWISPGETVAEFERVLNSLRDGELSAPFQSPFGWHLAQAMERRQEEMSEDRKKFNARQTVRARKADDAYQDWLRQQRDRAFVENRLEER
jgi:peptidyl-prolyl cis-trans isomerase SurA